MNDNQSAITLNNAMTVHQPSNRGITVNLRDWNRIRTGIGKLPMGGNNFMSAGWGFVGIAVAAGMQIISFAATSSSITGRLWTVTVSALVAGAIGAAVSFSAAAAKRKDHDRAKNDLQEDMDELLPDQLRD